MINFIGIIGAAIILVLFILEQIHKLNNDGLWYDIGNFVGSSLLVLYAYLLGSWPFLILNLIWAAVSLKDIIFDLKLKNKFTS